jgi:uncharacterized protein (TIGR02452 family)
MANFVAVPALNRGRPGAPRAYTSQELSLVTNKIRLMAELAMHHGHDSLVLGAWGSGVFNNDPVVIARLFKEVLTSSRYVDRFRVVAFAIFDEGPNLEAYRAEFGR